MVNLSFKSSNFPGSLNFLMKFAGDKLQVILYKSVCGISPQTFFSIDNAETLQVMHLLFGMEGKKGYKMKSFDLNKKAAHTYLTLPVICKMTFLKFGKKLNCSSWSFQKIFFYDKRKRFFIMTKGIPVLSSQFFILQKQLYHS